MSSDRGANKGIKVKTFVANALHWASALIFVSTLTLGLYMTSLEFMHPWYNTAPDFHKSTGIAVFFLIVFRSFWRFFFIEPAHILRRDWKRSVDPVLHRVFYILFFGIIFCGYLIPTADGRGVEFFGLFEVPALISYKEPQEEIAGTLHLTLVLLTLGLALLHTRINIRRCAGKLKTLFGM